MFAVIWLLLVGGLGGLLVWLRLRQLKESAQPGAAAQALLASLRSPTRS